jgi:DNA polymerase III gamma/tau subunit
MVSDLISAQSSTWDKLSSISSSKKIGSAYLFSGPVGSGKEGLALKFAQLINCKSGSI